MSYSSVSQQATTSEKQRSERDTRLRGSRLVFARILWGIIAIFEVAALIDSLSGTVRQLEALCTSNCTNLQLSAPGVSQLQHIGLSPGDYIAFYLAVTLIATLVCYSIAAVLVWRRSYDWMALLVSIMLMSFAPGILSNGVRFSQWLAPEWAAHLSALFDQITLLTLVLVFFIFPDSHFVPRWTRMVVGALLVANILLTIFPRFTSDSVNLIAVVVFLIVLVSLVIAPVYRYRRVSTPIQRQQTKWIVYSLVVSIFLAAVILVIPQFAFPALEQPGAILATAGEVVTNAVLTLIPISFGIAILRYRLYDIDIIINRTLVYGTLTALVVAIYIGSILLLQFLLRGIINSNNDVAIVISTLIIAALFQRLRHRVQAVIDRRFYRRKYDAARTLAAFSATLRSEVDLNELSKHLVDVVQETMQPAHVSLWLSKNTQKNKANTGA